jgi:AcrR family transcriptional regulator
MGRWEPDARGRLMKAAFELFIERGFDQVTVTQIAGRAGLTERTFFRHFADKPEVLFAGQAVLQERVLAAIAGAPGGASPLDVVAAAFESATAMFRDNREFARRRQAVIEANAELRERELTKLATLATAIAGALRQRGVPEPAASLAAEAGIAVFKTAFARWTSDGAASGHPRPSSHEPSAGQPSAGQPSTGQPGLTQLMRESLGALKAVAAASGAVAAASDAAGAGTGAVAVPGDEVAARLRRRTSLGSSSAGLKMSSSAPRSPNAAPGCTAFPPVYPWPRPPARGNGLVR